jgi:diguanylate cyclase (GGDEF)-like protein
MRVTESILSTLDPRTVVEQIADRLTGIMRIDNIAIGVHEPEARVVRTLFARGADAHLYRDLVLEDTSGMAGWVLEHGQAVQIPHTIDDSRYLHVGPQPVDSSAIFAPLRYRDRIEGILFLERLAPEEPFSDEEFELLQLFAGHVSIALQNAQVHQAMEIRAQTDSLTGLKNQGTFREALELAVARRTPFSLLIVDLDEFKRFNDSRGHEAGNVLLADISAALRRSCRDTDEVYRYGGDEFALILPVTDEDGAIAVAAKVGKQVRRVPIPGTTRPAGVTCSIGIAGFPRDGGDMEQVLLAADRACYVAKSTGRNRATTAAEAIAVAGMVFPTGPTPFDNPDFVETGPN